MNEILEQKGIASVDESEQRIVSLSSNSSVIQSYLLSVKRLTGAVAVSLFFQSKIIRGNSVLIFHEGEQPPLSALKNEQTASLFVEKIDPPLNSPVMTFFDCAEHNECMLRISIAEFISVQKGSGLATQRRKHDEAGSSPNTGEFIWLGLRYQVKKIPAILENIRNQQQGSLIADDLLDETDSLVYTLSAGGYMAWQHYKYFDALQDPVSQLPGRIELQACLKNMLDNAFKAKHPLTLLFINPDEFALINQRFDWEKGDQAIAEIAGKLGGCLRSSDALFRYGGAIFAVLLPQIGSNDASKVAEKIRRSLTGNILNSNIRLTFSIGVTVCQVNSMEKRAIDGTDMLVQADQALNQAKLSGGGCVVEWSSKEGDVRSGSFDRLSGIFTADTEKDYRNMQLLWETITVISSATETTTIATEFVVKIASALKFSRVALFVGEDEENNPQMIASSLGDEQDSGIKKNRLNGALTAKQFELLDTVKKSKRIERIRLIAKNSAVKDSPFAYAVPLIARGNYKGALYLDSLEKTLKLDSSDLVFLKGLATQVALALDRAELATQWKQEKEQESQKLREEVRDLRQFVKDARLVYRSAQMESILETLRTVAPTDITILITGESGTGKEVLAQTLHEYSDRKNKPMITVDCGAISQSLIESELFGHVKGAFTGAQTASEGRIVQADGGTLFLDEVGELPLEVQTKLLRFVQEKQITPVGGGKTRQVNVRIVAATNRELAEEVAAGRFRGDLYYRLKVVTIKSPALRDRPDDILPLAQHFLEKFAFQYQKGNLHFSEAAETALQQYLWPGNVRELQNTMIHAVVLASSEEVGSENLQFSEQKTSQISETIVIQPPVTQVVGGVAPLYEVYAPAETPKIDASPILADDPWSQLRFTLIQQLEEVLGNGRKIPVPIGKWLVEDLVLVANESTEGNARRAAKMLGLAETTFRRQLEKVSTLVDAGLLSRTASWSALSPIFSAIINSIDIDHPLDIIEQARSTLLQQVVNKLPRDHKKGAALMGVTGPTYKRLIESLSVHSV